MSFAILRLQKLKSFADVGGSLSHNYRNRETLNADSDRTHLNDHDLDTNEKCMSAIRDRIPEKRRKDAVLCIEHLITASPDWDGWGTEKETAFFEQSRKWLENKYGKKNVVSTTIHRDETTPHLVAYVVPLDEETGRLNAKKFIGGSRHTLSQMQTDFAVEVKDLGLDRGVQGSKAKHTSIKEYYEKLNNYENEPGIEKGLKYEVPEPDFFESKNAYGERVAETVAAQIIDQVSERFDRANTLASRADRFQKELSDTRKTLDEIQQRAKPYFDAIDGYNRKLVDIFDDQLNILKSKMDDQVQQYEIAYNRRQESEKIEKNKREFEKNWSERLYSMNSEQSKSFNFLLNHIIEFTHDDFERKQKVNELKRRLIEDPNYALQSFQYRNREKNPSKHEKRNDFERKIAIDSSNDFDQQP
jgi:hypothetical protein